MTITLTQPLPEPSDPKLNGEIVADLCRAAELKSKITLPAGEFWIPGKPFPIHHVVGQGPLETVLHKLPYDPKYDGQNVSFPLVDSTYENLTLQNEWKPGVQNILTGLGNNEVNVASTTSRLLNVRGISATCGFYVYAGSNNGFVLDNCEWYCARVAVGIWSSNEQCATVELYRNTISCIWETIENGGLGPGAGHTPSGNIQCCLLACGGRLRATYCHLSVQGGPIPTADGKGKLDRIALAMCAPLDNPGRVYGQGIWPWMRLVGCTESVNANGVPFQRTVWHIGDMKEIKV